ncbi:Transcription initiation factor TFIID subunit 1 [Bienertia sinuspersici]
MTLETASGSHDDRESDDDEEYEKDGGGNGMFGFMFGNVDNSGELEVDYLDESMPSGERIVPTRQDY